MTAFLIRPLILFTLLIALASTGTAEEFVIKPYRASYQAQYDFLLPFKGTATRELVHSESGEWVLAHHVKSPMIKLQEVSRFQWFNGRPLPISYQYHQSTLTKKKQVLLEFDWQSKVAVNKAPDEPVRFELQPNTLDKINYQLELRKELVEKGTISTYSVADRKRLKDYRFKLLGEELLETAVGTLKTVKIKRARGKGAERQTTIWLAKDWDYLVVQIHQVENGKSYLINLTEGELDGEPISGLVSAPKTEASTQQSTTQ